MRAEPGLPLHLILKAKVPSISALRMMLLRAHRFTASDALTHGVVDDVCPDPKYEELIANAVELALGVAQVAKSGPYYGYMKQQMYREAYRKCLDYTDEEAETWTHGKGMYGRLAGDPRFSGNKL